MSVCDFCKSQDTLFHTCPLMKEMINDPHAWHAARKAEIQRLRKENTENKYFITFTWNNSVLKSLWLSRVKFELSRKYVKSFKAVIEHADSNIHCHALLVTDQSLAKRHFSTFVKKCGFVDIKHVTSDNGIDQYGDKPMVSSLQELKID